MYFNLKINSRNHRIHVFLFLCWGNQSLFSHLHLTLFCISSTLLFPHILTLFLPHRRFTLTTYYVSLCSENQEQM